MYQAQPCIRRFFRRQKDMKNRKIWICSVLGAAVLAGAGCAQKQAGATVSQSAGKQETAERQKEAAEGMEPIYAAALKDGIYQIQVDSSSPMFRAEKCELTVKDGSLTARKKHLKASGFQARTPGRGKMNLPFRWRRWTGLLPAAPSVKGREPGMTALSYSERIPFRQRRLRKEI